MTKTATYARALDALLNAEACAERARRQHRKAPSYASRAALSKYLRRLRRIAAAEATAFRALPAGFTGSGVWR